MTNEERLNEAIFKVAEMTENEKVKKIAIEYYNHPDDTISLLVFVTDLFLLCPAVYEQINYQILLFHLRESGIDIAPDKDI